MGCYSASEWRLYRRKNVSPKQQYQMENHLFRCNRCLPAYLSVMEEREEELAGLLLPSSFTAETLHLIKARASKLYHRQRQSNRRRRTLINYVAAAGITLLLTAGGTFDTAIRKLPEAAAKAESTTRALSEIFTDYTSIDERLWGEEE